MKALILAAGKGTRLGSLTENIPKVMININGKPCLQHNIKFLKKYGVDEIAINTHHLSEKIKEYFEDGSKFGVNIRYSYEPELLGTSGALNNFRDFFNETFIVVYGDVIHKTDLKKMFEFHKEKDSFVTIALDNRENKTSAVVLDKDRIINFIEKPKEKIPNSYVNSGIYILEPEILKFIPNGNSDFGFNIFPNLLKSGEKLYGFNIGKVIDIGTFEGLKEAEDYFKSQREAS